MPRALWGSAALALAGFVAGCSSFDFGSWAPAPEPSSTPVAAATFKILSPDPLIGQWGVASYRDAKDRARTEKMARVHCKNAYSIAKGPTDGVMMHVADDPDLHELALKQGADGRTYLGFNVPPGDPADREVLELTPKLMVMKFVDPEVANRYGTFVYVRC